MAGVMDVGFLKCASLRQNQFPRCCDAQPITLVAVLNPDFALARKQFVGLNDARRIGGLISGLVRPALGRWIFARWLRLHAAAAGKCCAMATIKRENLLPAAAPAAFLDDSRSSRSAPT